MTDVRGSTGAPTSLKMLCASHVQLMSGQSEDTLLLVDSGSEGSWVLTGAH